MGDELKDQRVVTMMSSPELQEIDDWSFSNRIRSRGEAIRRLCQIGMYAEERLHATERVAHSLPGYIDSVIKSLITHGPKPDDKSTEEWNDWAHLTLAHLFVAKEEMEKHWLRIKVDQEALSALMSGNDLPEARAAHRDISDKADDIARQAFELASKKLAEDGFVRTINWGDAGNDGSGQD